MRASKGETIFIIHSNKRKTLLSAVVFLSLAMTSTGVFSSDLPYLNKLVADEFHQRDQEGKPGEDKSRLVCEKQGDNKWAVCGTTHYPVETQSITLGTHSDITMCPPREGYRNNERSVQNDYVCSGSFKYYSKKQVTVIGSDYRDVDDSNSHFYEKTPEGTLSGNIRNSHPITASAMRSRITSKDRLRYEREGGHDVNNGCEKITSNICTYTPIKSPVRRRAL